MALCYPYAFNDGDMTQRPYRITAQYEKRVQYGVQAYWKNRKFFSGPCMKLIPKKYFSWKDDNGIIEQDNKRHLGTSAQIVQKYYPNLAGSNEDGHLFVNYAGLNVVALKAIDLLHEKQEELNDRMDKIFSKLNK